MPVKGTSQAGMLVSEQLQLNWQFELKWSHSEACPIKCRKNPEIFYINMM